MPVASLRTFQANVENDVSNYNLPSPQPERATPSFLKRESRAFIFYIVVIYATFLLWGYSQEKITGTKYPSVFPGEEEITYKWRSPYVLSLIVATINFIVAHVVTIITSGERNTNVIVFWKVALATVVASPLGYMSLDYLSYPTMLLFKAAKPVPVIFAGVVYFQRRYGWHMYVGSGLICSGVFLFSYFKAQAKAAAETEAATVSSSSNIDDNDLMDPNVKLLIGLLYIGTHLGLEAFACNKQDFIFENEKSKPLEMMRHSNMWQAMFYAMFVIGCYVYRGDQSEMGKALHMFEHCPGVGTDIILFALCASVGQILVLGFIRRYGSLSWIKLNLTRQFSTVLISLVLFNHHVSYAQITGICLVFSGVALEIIVEHRNKGKKLANEQEEQEQQQKEEEEEQKIEGVSGQHEHADEKGTTQRRKPKEAKKND